jgi:hypothetical protein
MDAVLTPKSTVTTPVTSRRGCYLCVLNQISYLWSSHSHIFHPSSSESPYLFAFDTLSRIRILIVVSQNKNSRKSKSKEKIAMTIITIPQTLFPLCLLLLVRLGGYIVILCVFYIYKFIGKLTAFLQLQEFSLRNVTVTLPPCVVLLGAQIQDWEHSR